MNNWILAIGTLTGIAGGLLLAASLLLCVSYGLHLICQRIGNKIARVYHLRVIWYWLNRLEQEGSHCFEKAHEDGVAEANRQALYEGLTDELIAELRKALQLGADCAQLVVEKNTGRDAIERSENDVDTLKAVIVKLDCLSANRNAVKKET